MKKTLTTLAIVTTLAAPASAEVSNAQFAGILARVNAACTGQAINCAAAIRNAVSSIRGGELEGAQFAQLVAVAAERAEGLPADVAATVGAELEVAAAEIPDAATRTAAAAVARAVSNGAAVPADVVANLASSN